MVWYIVNYGVADGQRMYIHATDMSEAIITYRKITRLSKRCMPNLSELSREGCNALEAEILEEGEKEFKKAKREGFHSENIYPTI